MPYRGKWLFPARASVSDASACVIESRLGPSRKSYARSAAGVTIDRALGTIRKIRGNGPMGSPST